MAFSVTSAGPSDRGTVIAGSPLGAKDLSSDHGVTY